MPAILEELPLFLQDLFVGLPEDLNRDSRFCQRRRCLDASSFVRTLVFGWLDDPNASAEDLADYASTLGKPLTASALQKRFTPAAVELLWGVLDHALEPLFFGQPADLELLHRFHGVHLFDSSYLALPACLARRWPGCGNGTGNTNASCKMLLGFELTSAGLVQLDLFPGKDCDQKLIPLCQPLPQGALRLADLGFFGLERLDEYDQQGVFWLSRAHPQLVVQRPEGGTQSLVQFLSGRGDSVDEQVTVGTKKRLSCRLIAWRVPDAVARRRQKKRLEQPQRQRHRQRRARERANKGGRRRKGPPKARRAAGKPRRAAAPTAEQLAWCEWVVVLSNVPPEKLSVREAEALLRARWQVELLIKLWKGGGGLEQLRGKRAERVECELLAKLLGRLVCHWGLLSSAKVYLELSVTRAARKVKKYAERLGQALGQSLEAFRAVWQEMLVRISRCGKRRQGQKAPSTLQRLDGERPPFWVEPAAADPEPTRQGRPPRRPHAARRAG
jgi:Transposase DDE domain